jgi:hypothetical protein
MNQDVVRSDLKQPNLPTQHSSEIHALRPAAASADEIRTFHPERTGKHGTMSSRTARDHTNGMTELLTVADICRMLGVSRAWVIEHSSGRRRPVLPSIKLGKVRRFDPVDLECFISDCRRLGQTRVRSGSIAIQA